MTSQEVKELPVDGQQAAQSPPQDQANQNEEAKQQHQKKRCKKVKPTKGCIIRILIACLLVGFIVYLIVDFQRVRDGFVSFIEWLQNNIALGTFLLVLVYILATVLFVPGLLLTIGAGVALRAALGSTWQAILLGSFAVWIGAMFGSFFAMLLGRYLLRRAIQRKALKVRIFRAIDTALKKEGFKFTVLLRLCPLIPFSLLNYVFGLTSVSIKNYVFGGVGMIPGTIAYVYLGTTISNIAQASSGGFMGGPVQLSLIIIGSVLAIVAVVLVTIRAKKELNKLLKQEKEEEERKKKEEEQRAQKEGEETSKEPEENKSKENDESKTQENDEPSVKVELQIREDDSVHAMHSGEQK